MQGTPPALHCTGRPVTRNPFGVEGLETRVIVCPKRAFTPDPESSFLPISRSHPISLGSDHPVDGALSLALQRPHLGWCPHLESPGTREVVVISYGERHWQRTRQNIRAAAPDVWGEAESTVLVQPGGDEQGVERGMQLLSPLSPEGSGENEAKLS